MRALVTGATGFVGQRLVHGLLDHGWEVCCMVRRPVSPSRRGIATIIGDLLQPERLRLDPAETGPLDAVFHCAAMLPTAAATDSSLFIEANTTATLRLTEACERRGIGRFIYLSSISVIGEPRHSPITEDHPLGPILPYALGKLGGEFACGIARSRNIKATAFRLSSPYGPGMNPATVLPLFVRLAQDGKPIRWHGSGSRSQDFIHVDDIVTACLRAVEAAEAGTYCLGSGEATSMRRLAELTTTLIPGSHSEASGQPDPQEGRSWQLDMRAASRDLDFTPTVSIEEGLADYIASLKAPSRLWWS